jgi:hypothetical protein
MMQLLLTNLNILLKPNYYDNTLLRSNYYDRTIVDKFKYFIKIKLL